MNIKEAREAIGAYGMYGERVLNEKFRFVVESRIYERKSFEEIGNELGYDDVLARALYHRALRKLLDGKHQLENERVGC